MIEIIAVVAIVANCISTIVHCIIDYKKSKEPPKDVVWETALQLAIASGKFCDPDVLADYYQQLSVFKEMGCKLPPNTDLIKLTDNARQAQSEAQHSLQAE